MRTERAGEVGTVTDVMVGLFGLAKELVLEVQGKCDDPIHREQLRMLDEWKAEWDAQQR